MTSDRTRHHALLDKLLKDYSDPKAILGGMACSSNCPGAWSTGRWKPR
jgi:hypothetical protein